MAIDWRQAGRTAFGLDLRSLALFRIALASVVLIDLAQRASSLTAHYTAGGAVPAQAIEGTLTSVWRWSIHALFDTPFFVGALFVIHILAALALLVGWRTRLATFVTWALLCSLHTRNFMVLYGGDILLRVMLFWAMFLPLGARMSVDTALGGGEEGRPVLHVSVASVALTLQICFVYWFTVELRRSPEWRTEMNAVFLALHLDHYATAFGVWLRERGAVLPLLTRSTMLWEFFGPFFLFVPLRGGVLRLVAILGFFGLHIGIAAALRIGMFPLIAMTAWCVFLPGVFWDWLARCAPAMVRWAGGLQGFFRRLARGFTPASPPRRPRWPTSLALAVLLTYVLIWNLRGTYPGVVQLPAWWNGPGLVVGLDQKWDLFAPYPAVNDGWFVVPARLEEGREVDLYRGGQPVSFDKPERVSAEFKDNHWRKFMRRLLKHERFRPLYLAYLCREWQPRLDERIETASLYYVRERTTNEGPEPPRKDLLHQQSCGVE